MNPRDLLAHLNFPGALAFLGALIALGYAVVVAARRKHTGIRWAFAAGMFGFALEGLFSGLSFVVRDASELIKWQTWRLVATGFVIPPWIIFSQQYSRGIPTFRRINFILVGLSFLVPLVGLFMWQDLILEIRAGARATATTYLILGKPALAIHLSVLVGSIVILANLERTYRAAVGMVRWRIKFLLLGLALLFIIRVYTSSQALIIRSIDAKLELSNAGALLVGCLVMLRSLLRDGHFEIDVYPSSAVIRSSVTILLAGIYFILVGVVAKLAGFFGIESELGASGLLLLVSLLGFAAALQSDRVNLRLRQFVSRNFQRPFYDYRSVWRLFTETTTTQLTQEGLCRAVIRQIGEIFQANAISLWLTNTEGDALVCVASSALPESRWVEVAPSAETAALLHAHFKERHDPAVFETTKAPWADALRSIHPREFDHGGERVVMPLISHNRLLGLLIVGDRVAGHTRHFDAQDMDMLRCVADHTAANLLNIQLSTKAAQSRELEAFRMMATFFVHDLKNAASTLNLMLPNLPLHWDNAEFRKDALRGITKTVDHINSLIVRMGRMRDELKVDLQEADLNETVRRAVGGWENVPDVVLDCSYALLHPVRHDREQMSSVITNLVLNARDAVLAGGKKPGRVEITTQQSGAWEVVTVADNGCGMTPEFISKSLFKPFQTTKKNGLGIGMFQSKMIVEAHGGRLAVESVPLRGTTFRVYLPYRTADSPVIGASDQPTMEPPSNS